MKRNGINLLLFLLTILFAMPSQGPAQQDNIRAEGLSIKQGLSQNTVNSILQDKNGFLWFATQDGLNRYDGYDFTVFQADPDVPGGLNKSFTLTLLEDNKGIIWIGTYGGGLNRLDPTTGAFKHYMKEPRKKNGNGNSGKKENKKEGNKENKNETNDNSQRAAERYINGNSVSNIVQDPFGILWVGTWDGVLNRFDPQKELFTHYPLAMGGQKKDGDRAILSMCMGAGRLLWIGTRGGLYRFDPDTERYTFFPLPTGDKSKGKSFPILALVRDTDGHLWIGTDGNGLFRLNPAGRIVAHFRREPGKTGGIQDNAITALFQDQQGLMWIGTRETGLYRLDWKKKTLSLFNDEATISGGPRLTYIFSLFTRTVGA